ncbi:MAG: cytochrome C biogenesis protein CcsA [Candidatus Electrothrix sp. EH2]|nr:cytochrome C biogenesis protein CcsA [Candidatus Electrothrix sp. EH2]
MKSSVVALIAAASLLVAGSALASEDLAKEKKCTTCHKIDTKTVGPSYKDIANGDGVTAERLAKSILEGSKDQWGAIPMAKQDVTEDEAKTLAEWIVGLKAAE